jgi:predicted amidophosphoribosyltransferase
VGLSHQERLQNVADAFEADPTVSGGRWLLVDDVCTSGATLEGCAAALRAKGATQVWAVVLARPLRMED